MNLVQTTGSFEFDTLIADTSLPIQTAISELASGQGVLLRGSVIGKSSVHGVLIGGEAKPDGETVPAEFILAEDVDTGSTPGSTVNAILYRAGSFNRFKLIFGGTETSEAHEYDLKKAGIYLKAVL